MLRHRFIARPLAAIAAVSASTAIGAPAALAADATTTVVTSSPALVWGQALTATVTDDANMTLVPTGTVQFRDNGVPIGAAVPLSAGTGSLSRPGIDLGPHTISAVYTPGDLNAFMASTSADASVMVGKAGTSTTLTVTPNPTVTGQAATFTASVTASPPGAGTPTGLVVFANPSGSMIDTVALDATGHASTQAYGFAGPHTVLATYQGDGRFNMSGGMVGTQVNRAATTTTLTVSPNPATPGATIFFEAVVAIVAPGDVDPTGTLQFTIDGVAIGAPTALGNGTIGVRGSLTAPPGNRTYVVGVSYSGDDDTEPSSASVGVTVNGPAVAAGQSSQTKVTRAALRAMASRLTTALRLRGFAALTSTAQTLTAGPGVVAQTVSAANVPRGARAAARKPVVVATGRHRFAAAGTGTLRLKLTKAGRRAIRHAKSLRLTIVTRYTPTGGTAVVSTQRLTVRAKGKPKAVAATARGWQHAETGVNR